MKTIIKFVIAAIILFACGNVAMALVAEYQFEDEVHEALLFDPRMTDNEIVDVVLKAAASHDVPITANDITIKQTGPDIRVDMSYTKDMVVIPGVFSTPWTFRPSASTRLLVGNRRSP